MPRKSRCSHLSTQVIWRRNANGKPSGSAVEMHLIATSGDVAGIDGFFCTALQLIPVLNMYVTLTIMIYHDMWLFYPSSSLILLPVRLAPNRNWRDQYAKPLRLNASCLAAELAGGAPESGSIISRMHCTLMLPLRFRHRTQLSWHTRGGRSFICSMCNMPAGIS